jgi:MinD superfamily P-loop ATPase
MYTLAGLTLEMKEIVIVSGKGGVGKSSITASLAVLLKKNGVNVTAVDTDVDAPNLAIVLGTALDDFVDVKASEKASIDQNKCVKCGKCITACKPGALIGIEKKPVLIPFLCEGCGVCTIVCPTSAISIVRRVNGRIGVAETPYGFKLVSGQLDMGESSSGHIVTAVKSRARAVAEDSKSDLIIVDGPPGIGCPVIASVAGANYALVITEPTPAARNSLDRMISVLGHFDIPASIVINRFDLNPDYAHEMEEWINAKWNMDVVQKVPADDNVLISLSKRIPVVEHNPDCEASRAISAIASRILTEIPSGSQR